jgi:hypothetical protein
MSFLLGVLAEQVTDEHGIGGAKGVIHISNLHFAAHFVKIAGGLYKQT